VLDSLIFLNLPAKKAGGKIQWVVAAICQYVTLQKQTSLLIHCTKPRPLIFIGLDNSPRNSGANMRIFHGAGKAQAEIAACHATQICTKIQPGHRLAPLIFILSYI
jgi:hypothetical protein